MLTLAAVAAINAAVNLALRPCHRVGPCSADFQPRTAGAVDCKQYAAVKLRALILAGAQPGEFSLWLVRKPGAAADGPNHAVLVHNPTGRVLDVPGPMMATSMGPQRANELSTRAFLEREGTTFVAPCPACELPARLSALRAGGVQLARYP